MFIEQQTNNTTYWYDPTLLIEPVEQAFCLSFWDNQQAIIGSARGRGTTWFLQGQQASFALRHYHRGGLLGRWIKDHYCFTGWQNTRAYQELHLLAWLSEHGVNVPAPVAAKVERHGLTYQADILVQKLDNANDLVAILAENQLQPNQLERIGQEIRKMHDAGVNHTDLNIHNILIDSEQRVWIIDFDKCRKQTHSAWKQKNLQRLQRSFNKEHLLGNIKHSEQQWQQIVSGYYGR
ncbi:3-deoxy-D-manno-octulosonic acid kinase [Vibrio metschnikovii]|uniref:3-deoxy-D-manno-octulosonic acid kinase n=1 Tax=Vibrio metschnikovii TaxID=28172 RepID=UPI002FC8E171